MASIASQGSPLTTLQYALGLNRNRTQLENALLAVLVITALFVLAGMAVADGTAGHLGGLDLIPSTSSGIDRSIAVWEK